MEHLSKISIAQIQQFLTIVKHMNLTKASKELYMSQPALSASLSKLEKELGIPLFYRDATKLIITPAGESIRERFDKLIGDYEALLLDAKTLREDNKHIISIGFSGSPILFASLYMTDFLSYYNGISIKKSFVDRDTLIRQLNEQTIDFAISSPVISTAEISSMIVLKEELGLAVSTGHPLAQRDHVRFRDLKDVRFTGLLPAHSIRMIYDERCAHNNFKPAYKRECAYLEYFQIIERCRGGDDFCAFAGTSHFNTSYGDGYRFIHIDGDDMFRTISLSWSTKRNMQLQYSDLVEHIKDGFAEQYDYYTEMFKHLNLGKFIN